MFEKGHEVFASKIRTKCSIQDIANALFKFFPVPPGAGVGKLEVNLVWGSSFQDFLDLSCMHTSDTK